MCDISEGCYEVSKRLDNVNKDKKGYRAGFVPFLAFLSG